MIFEMISRCLDDLRTRWQDLQQASHTLATALGTAHPMHGTVAGWEATSTAQIKNIDRSRQTGFPPIPSLLAFAQHIFTLSEADFRPIYQDALGIPPSPSPGVLVGLRAAPDGRVVAAARVAEARLEDLRQLIEQCLQEIVEIAGPSAAPGVAFGTASDGNEGARANLTGIRGSVEDISTYPILTQEMGQSWAPAAPGPATPGGTARLGLTVQKAIADVLGRRRRLDDPQTFVMALNQSFTCKEAQGRTVCEWVPRAAYITQTDLGGTLTGAQASLYHRAKEAQDSALPLLDKVVPLLPEADLEEVEAVRAIVRTEFVELVNEFGVEGGPRVLRVNELFDLLLHSSYTTRAGVVANDGEVGRLADVFGLTRDQVNTLEEERNLTDYLVLRDYLRTLEASWNDFQPNFLGQVDNFFGTQLVLLQRSLAVAAESVDEMSAAMDSVFLGPAERQTTRIDFPAPTPPMFVHELLSWVQTYSSEEAPRIVQDGGKRGARTIVRTLGRLRDLVRAADGRIRHPGGRHPRVRRMLSELAAQLDQAAHLAGTIQ